MTHIYHDSLHVHSISHRYRILAKDEDEDEDGTAKTYRNMAHIHCTMTSTNPNRAEYAFHPESWPATTQLKAGKKTPWLRRMASVVVEKRAWLST
jgi:hypothetical protein